MTTSRRLGDRYELGDTLGRGGMAEVFEGLAVVPDHAAQRHQHQNEPHQYHLQQGAWAYLGHLGLSQFSRGGSAYLHSPKKQNRPKGRFMLQLGYHARPTDATQIIRIMANAPDAVSSAHFSSTLMQTSFLAKMIEPDHNRQIDVNA